MEVAICFVFLACGSMISSVCSLVAVPPEQEFQTSRMVLMLANTALAPGSAAFVFYALVALAVLFLVPRVRLHPRDEADALAVPAE